MAEQRTHIEQLVSSDVVERFHADGVVCLRDAVDQEIEILTEYGPFKRAEIVAHLSVTAFPLRQLEKW